MCDTCGDNRFELIEKYKKKLLEATNISDSPEEMAVINNILFRFWQMGWLKGDLFGISEQLESDHIVDPGNMVGDLISRAAAIDYCHQLINTEHQQGSDEMNYGQERVNQTETILHHLEVMPSAQPPKEIPKRVLWSGWKGYRDTRYKCPNCEKPVRNDDAYCHRCGQRLMFPHISFTDYVPGQKQDVIVRWDDEG